MDKIMSDLPEENLSKPADSDKNCESGYTPIILNVRGNATDIDNFKESSTATNVSKVSVFSSTTSTIWPEDTRIDSLAIPVVSPVNNQVSAVQPPEGSSRGKIVLNHLGIVTSVSDTVPISKGLQLSSLGTGSGSVVLTNVTTPAAKLLLSLVSSIPESSGSFLTLNPTQPSTSLGSAMSTATMKKHILTSASKTSPSVNKKGGIIEGKDSSTPISSTVKIIVKGSDKSNAVNGRMENKDNNDKFDTESLCQDIVNKIFTNYERQMPDGLSRVEAMNSKLLDPCKKQRKHLDRQFVCSICGDEFHLEEFLNNHFDRKTFELVYKCPGCNKKKSFYNKCKFWLHVRNERPKFDKEMLRYETSYFKLKPYLKLEESGKDLTHEEHIRCKFCQNVFKSVEERSLHLQRNTPYLYTCNKCSMLIGNKCSLLAHVSIHNTKAKDHVCPQCGEDIDHSEGLKVLFEHLDACFHFNTCYVMPCVCGESFATTAAFKLHFLKSHTKSLFRCHVCGSCFSTIEFLNIHCRRSHKLNPTPCKIVLCTVCSQGFPNHLRLKAHVESHAAKMIGVRKKVLKCFLCDKCFYNPKSLASHVEKEHTHRPKRCTICFGLFESRQCLVQHIVSKCCSPDKIPNKLHVCLDKQSTPKAVGDVNYKDLFKTTQRSLLPKPDSNSKAMTLVEGALISSTTSSTSLVSSSGEDVSSKSVSSFSTPPAVSSSTKPKMSVSADKSSSHRVVGPQIRFQKFQCHSCQICLLGLAGYNKHAILHKSLGVDMQQNFCHVCKKTIVSEPFQAHMEEHQKKGSFACILCGSNNFKNMLDALNHSKHLCYYSLLSNEGASQIVKEKAKSMKEHNEDAFIEHNEDVEQNEGSLEDQSANTAPIEEKATVFPCLICGLAFSCKQEKEDHVSRFHDGTRTLYFCLVCKRKGIQKSFSLRNMLWNHISRKHRIVNPGQIAKSIGKEEQNVASGQVVASESNDAGNGDAPPPKRLRLANEGEFMCGKCGFSSEDSKLFANHIITHNPKKEPQCPECGLCFTVLAALKKHLFVVHKIKAMDEYLESKGMIDSEEELYEDNDSFDSNKNGPHSNAFSLSKAPKYKKTRPSNKKTSDFECSVCYRSLPSETALQKHMRNHGMAFIRSRRYDKT